MNQTLTHKIQALTESASLAETDQALTSIMHDLGCGNFSYNYYPLDFKNTAKALHVVCTQEVKGWQEHYSTNHYDQIDPIMRRMRNSHLPLAWKLEDELAHHEKNQRRVFLDAIDFGFHGGFAVPVHAPLGEFANLVVQDASILAVIKHHPEMIHTLQLTAYHYHARVSHLIATNQSIDTMITLTERETECLRLTLQHKTAKEIARILNITARTAGFHLENSFKKLLVSNKYQAASKAEKLGLL
ncbi:MAG: LuxR family transcriptional regulator [Gammaproteobacteria bacterium]